VTVHAILVIYQDQVDAFHAREHSIFIAKAVSPTVQLGSFPHQMNAWDVTVHAILAIKLELMDASHAQEHSISTTKPV
jgi:hypothetical protein